MERVWVEMGKILTGNHAPHLVRAMYHLGVAKNIGMAEDKTVSSHVPRPPSLSQAGGEATVPFPGWG